MLSLEIQSVTVEDDKVEARTIVRCTTTSILATLLAAIVVIACCQQEEFYAWYSIISISIFPHTMIFISIEGR